MPEKPITLQLSCNSDQKYLLNSYWKHVNSELWKTKPELHLSTVRTKVAILKKKKKRKSNLPRNILRTAWMLTATVRNSCNSENKIKAKMQDRSSKMSNI